MKRHSENSKVKKDIQLSSILMVIISIEFLLNYVTIHFNSEEILVVILMVIINWFLINYVTKHLNVKYISVVISMVIINWFLVNYVTKYLNIKDISVVIWMDNGHTSEHYFKCTYCENDFRHKSLCKIHLLTHTVGNTLICKISGIVFTQVHPI